METGNKKVWLQGEHGGNRRRKNRRRQNQARTGKKDEPAKLHTDLPAYMTFQQLLERNFLTA